MRLLLLVLLATICISCAEKEDCSHNCKQTEHKSYIDCIQKRIKRSINCGNELGDCQSCDCDYCVINSCPQSCNICCENTPSCTTNKCCHKTCHSRCKTTSCRSDCRKLCYEKLTADGYNVTNTNTPRRNITTVINIHNIINNTNIIDIPIDVNNTNINNITISDRSNDEEEEEEGEEDEQSYAKEYDKCCYIYSPRKCSKLDTYPFFKCVQERKKVCGNICISPIIHEQPYRHCHPSNTGLSCQEKTMYVPQPQPSCSYQQAWPYVMCGNPQPTYCGGCYQHYNFQPTLVGCPYYCYDDGYRQGSLYRKGPFYRPGYSHIPSCYQTATCAPNYNNYFAYPNSGYPANPYPNPGFAYPPNSYPNSYPPRVIVHQNSSSNSTKDSTSINKSPFPSYYNIPLFPPYISTGYQYPRSPPVYILPPEVDIQAIITHPENENRYAQITINKPDNEEEPFEDEDVD